ncbi:MAG: sulfatase-like hydrolase/transferase, partial [Proteobacteria bacterium]|nr:sulfatase-like hydrolase/transferase [Pseudomonadota bacterium]
MYQAAQAGALLVVIFVTTGLDLLWAMGTLRFPVASVQVQLAAVDAVFRWGSMALFVGGFALIFGLIWRRSPSDRSIWFPAAWAGLIAAGAMAQWMSPNVADSAWSLTLRTGLCLGVAVIVVLLATWKWFIGWGLVAIFMLVWIVLGPPAISSNGSRAIENPDAPDILLITIDTWRADSLSGSSDSLVPGLTPFLERLGEDNCRLERAIAPAPLTGPSHAGLLSGLNPIELNVLLNGRTLPEERPWIPAILAQQGFRTVAFVSSAMLDGDLGFHDGFDVYDDDLNAAALVQQTTWYWMRLTEEREFDRPGSSTLERLVLYTEEYHSDPAPWFIWLHIYNPHGPYQPTDESAAFVEVAEPTFVDAMIY